MSRKICFDFKTRLQQSFQNTVKLTNVWRYLHYFKPFSHFRLGITLSKNASLPTVKRFCIDAILSELSCAKCFQYETYHAPLGRPFFTECNVKYLTIYHLCVRFWCLSILQKKNLSRNSRYKNSNGIVLYTVFLLNL